MHFFTLTSKWRSQQLTKEMGNKQDPSVTKLAVVKPSPDVICLYCGGSHVSGGTHFELPFLSFLSASYETAFSQVRSLG